MADYISKEAVLSKCDDMWYAADETTQTGVDTINTIDEITDFIESLPITDVQPIICCKDCKHAQNPNDTMIYCTYFECGTMSQNDFCSQGERRVKNG